MSQSRLIFVTQERIRYSARKNSAHCWVADAIREALPEVRFIAVDLQTIRWSDPKKRVRYAALTPRPVQRAIIEFDRGVVPEAFSFRLRAAWVVPIGRCSVVQGQMSEGGRLGKGALKGALKRATKQAKRGGAKLRSSKGERAGNVPVTEGGRMPPAGYSRRREFGMRAFPPMEDGEGRDGE